MAVTAVVSRAASVGGGGHTYNVGTSEEFCIATLTGTYVQGGFTFNPFAIPGGPGTSPLPGSKVIGMQWSSPNGYIYASTTNNITKVTTTKIFSAPGTELAAGALPDTTVPVTVYKTRS